MPACIQASDSPHRVEGRIGHGDGYGDGFTNSCLAVSSLCRRGCRGGDQADPVLLRGLLPYSEASHLRDPSQEHLSLQTAQMVDEEDAVEVVQLVAHRLS